MKQQEASDKNLSLFVQVLLECIGTLEEKFPFTVDWDQMIHAYLRCFELTI